MYEGNGVPITFLKYIGKKDGSSGFQLLDGTRPKISGKEKYYRLIIGNLKPDLPEVVNISEMLEQAGIEAMIIPVKTMQKLS